MPDEETAQPTSLPEEVDSTAATKPHLPRIENSLDLEETTRSQSIQVENKVETIGMSPVTGEAVDPVLKRVIVNNPPSVDTTQGIVDSITLLSEELNTGRIDEKEYLKRLAKLQLERRKFGAD